MILLRRDLLGASWEPVIQTLNMFFKEWEKSGPITLDVDVTALRDSDGVQLFSILITQKGISQSASVPVVYPFTVTISDGRGRREHLRFLG